MSLLYFGLVTAGILFAVMAYIFIFSVQFSMADNRSLFIKAFVVALIAIILNGVFFLGVFWGYRGKNK